MMESVSRNGFESLHTLSLRPPNTPLEHHISYISTSDLLARRMSQSRANIRFLVSSEVCGAGKDESLVDLEVDEEKKGCSISVELQEQQRRLELHVIRLHLRGLLPEVAPTPPKSTSLHAAAPTLVTSHERQDYLLPCRLGNSVGLCLREDSTTAPLAIESYAVH